MRRNNFTRINTIADEWANCDNPVKKTALRIELLTLLYELLEPQLKQHAGKQATIEEEQIFFLGVRCSYDLVMDTIMSVLGLTQLKNGKESKSVYDPEKGSKFTSF